MKARYRCLCDKPDYYLKDRPMGFGYSIKDATYFDEDFLFGCESNILHWRTATTECSRCGVPLCEKCGIENVIPLSGWRWGHYCPTCMTPTCVEVMR